MSPLTRRPVPALVALLALLLLTGLVWWRVLHRGGGNHPHATCPTRTQTVATLPAPASITVQVLNATNRAGIAAKARTALVGAGFKIPALASNDTRYRGRVLTAADIRYGPKGKAGAELLHYYLPGARLVSTRSTSATVVVSLGAKYRAVAAPSTVQAALTRARIAVASSSPSAPSNGASPSC